MTYQQHPLSAAFPAMAPNEFVDLKDSIEIIGLQNPITLFEGMVLDGWNRYMACTELGMPFKTVELGNVDPRDFVMAQNKARRHVTQAQLALATTAVYAWKPVGANQHDLRVGTECPPKSNSQLAEVAGVSEKTIKQAKAVQTKAAPEVLDAVKTGAIGLPKAAAIAQLPKDEQAAAINKPLPKKAKPTPEPVSPEAEAAASFDPDAPEVRLQEANEALVEIAAENERLADENAALKASGTSEEQQVAAELIADLRERVRILEIDNESLAVSRDTYLNENAQLKKQIKLLQRKQKESEHEQSQAF